LERALPGKEEKQISRFARDDGAWGDFGGKCGATGRDEDTGGADDRLFGRRFDMRLVAWLALVAALAPAALARTPAKADQLQVGSVALTLGMPEKPALAALKHHYRVERARGSGDNWAVMERNGETVAMISFRDGKLNRAAKTWYSTGGHDAARLADRLYTLAGEFTGEGRTQCTLSAKPYRTAGVEGRIVTLVCGSKSIQINRSQMGDGHFATSLREVLQ
jgi:hypothetical protein